MIRYPFYVSIYFYDITWVVDCVWSEWFIGECSERCDGGKRTNVRYKEIVESNGGSCSGDFKTDESCNTDSCPGKRNTISITKKSKAGFLKYGI